MMKKRIKLGSIYQAPVCYFILQSANPFKMIAQNKDRVKTEEHNFKASLS